MLSKGKTTTSTSSCLMSSVSGSVGVATESNYCASNYFLDMFARYRLNAGLQAISVGLGMISQIGYLHEHPDIKNGLVQKGVSAIDADDFLQIIDATLSASSNNTAELGYDKLSKGHILTGLEPLGLNELRKKGFEGIPATFDDPRAALLNDALSGGIEGQANAFTSGLPAELAEASRSGRSIFDATLSVIVKQFSNFLLTPVEKLDVSKPLAGFGMDSLLAAAVRSWFYRKFKVDLAFMTPLSQTISIRDLAQSVSEQVEEQIQCD